MWVSEAGKPAYLRVIKSALTDPQIFSNFKSIRPFMQMVGRNEDLFALECYKEVERNPEVYRNLSAFRKNDTLGSPVVSPIQRLGADTLRFAQTVSRIQETFGNMDGKSIVEFGSNYGGLCFCMLAQWPRIKSYTLIDLPEVQALSFKYLGELGVSGSVISTEVPAVTDLFISELALTEFTDDDLYTWYEQYAKNAGGLFLRANILDSTRSSNFTEFMRQDFNLEIEEEHIMRRPNTIVTGTL